jgi:hypothetical protein
MRTCVRVLARAVSCVDPPCRPRLVLRLGRATRRSDVAGSAHRGRRRRRARRELRGQGVRRQDRHVGPNRPTALPEPDRGAAAFRRLHRSQSAGVRHLPRHLPHRRADVDRRSIHRRRRTVANRGTADADRHRAAPARRRRGRAADQRRRGPHQVPRQGGERRVASPTGCWWSNPTANSTSSTRCRCNGCGVSARSPPRSCTSADCTPSPTSRRCSRRAHGDRRSFDGPPTPRAGTQPRCSPSEHRQAPGLDRVAAGAWVGDDDPATRSTSCCGGWSTAWPADAPGRSGRPDDHATAALRRPHPGHRSHSLPDPTAAHHAVHATAPAMLDGAWPLVETRGISLLGVSVGNLSDVDAVQLVLPFERASPSSSTRCSTRSTTASVAGAPAGHHDARRPRHPAPDAARLTSVTPVHER